MMLTSAGQRGDAQRCRELGIAVYLIKPIRQSELLEAILAALGKAPASGERATVITRHTLRETRRKLQILLAEDNPVNQQLVIRLLEKRGHVVTVASNGSEALALLKIISIRPRADGRSNAQEWTAFQATAAIRKEEEATGKHLPIIAMTAHAMEGDRERCLAAGMDGYVPKPIKVEDLVEAIENLGRPREVAQVATTAEPREQEPIDTASALARVEGDVGLAEGFGGAVPEGPSGDADKPSRGRHGGGCQRHRTRRAQTQGIRGQFRCSASLRGGPEIGSPGQGRQPLRSRAGLCGVGK